MAAPVICPTNSMCRVGHRADLGSNEMNTRSFKRVSEGELRGWLREDLFRLLPPGFFNSPVPVVKEMGGKVIKKSKLRWAAILTLPGGRRIFLKRDRTKGWFESLKFLFLSSKARKEWSIAYQLKEKDLNVPQPLGWMEKVHRGLVKESYYLSEAIGSGASLIEDSTQSGTRFPIDELAKTVRKIHDSGLFHKDLHAGNLLWNGELFYLIDLHRAKIVKAVSFRQRLWNLSQLFHSLRPVWSEREENQFIQRYLEGGPASLSQREELLQQVHALMDRLQKRQWKSRTKRCLKESTGFSIRREEGVRYYHRRDYPMDRLKRAVKEHLKIVKEKPMTLVKHSPKVIVSILDDGEEKVCVKHFLYPQRLAGLKERFRRSKGLKAWIAGNGLIVRGIPFLKPFALAERRGWLGLRESFLLMETSETGQELDRYLFKGFKDLRGKRLFIKAFAQWVSQFHKMDLYHEDMKTCNILVSQNGASWNFHLLDLEDILLDEKVAEKSLFKNFLQLNASTPKIITRTDRLRFFREYLTHRSVALDKERMVRKIVRETRKRGIVYVAPWGVVEENSIINKG
jgi:tRNA A-37 threonylcarbamoyl transferase component Bud32